jgi:hypothetical protein
MPGHDFDRMVDDEIVRFDRMVMDLRLMDAEHKGQMLADVIQNMRERNDDDEIVRFLIDQLGGDTEEIIKAYARR